MVSHDARTLLLDSDHDAHCDADGDVHHVGIAGCTVVGTGAVDIA